MFSAGIGAAGRAAGLAVGVSASPLLHGARRSGHGDTACRLTPLPLLPQRTRSYTIHRYRLRAPRPDTKKAYVLLREGASSLDCLHASFFGHVFLHLMDDGSLDAPGLPQLPPALLAPPSVCTSSSSSSAGKGKGGTEGSTAAQGQGQGDEAWRGVMARAKRVVDHLYPDFLSQAERSGWKLQQTMLNPKENRILQLHVKPLVA